MSWFKVIVSAHDQGAGLRTRIKNKFDELFVKAGGPADAALLKKTLPDGIAELYFSPGASRFAYMLIADYEGVSCDKPSGKLSLLVGNLQPEKDWLIRPG